MSANTPRERKETRRYTFVVVPDAKAEATRTFSVTPWGLIGVLASVFLVIIALIFAVIIYTPLGRHLPISSPELARQYGRQIVDIQRQLHGLVQEIGVLRSYNFQLRRAMGEKITDSLGAIASGPDSSEAAAGPPSDDARRSHEVLPGVMHIPPPRPSFSGENNAGEDMRSA